MKKLIISVYVAIVIAVSLLAQASFAASNTELRGAYVVLSQDGSELLVVGRYPNPCISNAQVELAPGSFDTIVLQVRAEKKNDACIALLGDAFKMVMPVGSLKEKLAALSIDPNGTYKVVTADGRFNETIDFAQATETEQKGDFTTMIKVNIKKHPGVQF